MYVASNTAVWLWHRDPQSPAAQVVSEVFRLLVRPLQEKKKIAQVPQGKRWPVLGANRPEP